jgi:3',5'-cyclic AMP phosphodiesterase CpdA
MVAMSRTPDKPGTRIFMDGFITRRQFAKRAAALGLLSSAANWRDLLAAPIASAVVHGHIVSGGEPVRGVRVSDGYRVVASDESGRFSLQVGRDSGAFVFMTVPDGYWTNQFYVPTGHAVEKPPVFELGRRRIEPQYTAIYLTDVHLGEGRADQSYSAFAATIDEINRLDPPPAVCWVGGDITLQGGKGARYVELMSRLKMPVRNAVGNHEMLVRESDPRARYQQLFGPTYYSYEIGKVHFITLDGCHAKPEVDGYKNVEGLVSPRELHWLAADLEQVPDSVAKVVSIHIPLVSDYAQRRGTTAEKVPWWIVRNADQVIDLLSRHGVSLVLQGHLHENQRIVHRGIEFVESISVCGRWWKAVEGKRENGVSGEPRGYRLLQFDGSTIRHRYQSSAEARVSAVGEIAGEFSNVPAHQDAMLPVNVFDPSPDTIVEASINGGPSERLAPGTSQHYHEDLTPAHHWTWRMHAKALTLGRHLLRAQVREPIGPAQQIERVLTAVLP